MMYDQLHAFADEASAIAAFGDGEGMASWLHDGVTVMQAYPVLHDPDADTTDENGSPVRGEKPAGGYWLGIATADLAAHEACKALPSCRFPFIRPEVETPWRDCLDRPALPTDAVTILRCNSFAGSSYVYD